MEDFDDDDPEHLLTITEDAAYKKSVIENFSFSINELLDDTGIFKNTIPIEIE